MQTAVLPSSVYSLNLYHHIFKHIDLPFNLLRSEKNQCLMARGRIFQALQTERYAEI